MIVITVIIITVIVITDLSVYFDLTRNRENTINGLARKQSPDKQWKKGIVTAEIISRMEMNVVPSPRVVDIIKEFFFKGAKK